MTLFEKLFVAHLVGDWLLQTEWQALNKSRNNWALFSHISVYSLVILGVLIFNFGFQKVSIYLVVGLLAISHVLLDRGRFLIGYMRTFRLLVDRKPQRWLTMAVDQTFHILLIALATIILDW